MTFNKKRFAAGFLVPVWILALLFSIQLLFLATIVLAMLEMQARHGGQLNKASLWLGCFFVFVVAAEGIIYWLIRKKIYKRAWVWAHLICLIVSLVVIPVVFLLLPWLLANFSAVSNAVNMQTANKWRFYLFWGIFMSGHIFFIATVMKSAGTVPGAEEDLIDAIGIDE